MKSKIEFEWIIIKRITKIEFEWIPKIGKIRANKRLI